MKIKKPMRISARLMIGLPIDNDKSEIHLFPLGDFECDGTKKIKWKYIIEEQGKDIEEGDSLYTLTGDPQDAMGTFLSFLSAAAEAYSYEMRGGTSENSDLFNEKVNEWAYQHSDEIQMLALEIEGEEG